MTPDLGRRKARLVLAPPIWGIGRAGNSLVYSELFRSVHGTRRTLYGSLNGAVNRLWRGRFKNEAARVHLPAWRRGGVAARGAGAAARHAGDRPSAQFVVRRLGVPRGSI